MFLSCSFLDENDLTPCRRGFNLGMVSHWGRKGAPFCSVKVGMCSKANNERHRTKWRLVAKEKGKNTKLLQALTPEPPLLNEALHGRTLTLEVARLRAPEAGGQLLQSLRQGAHHVAKQPLFLLRAGPTGLAGQCLHRTLAPVEELGEQVALTAGRRVGVVVAQGAPRPLRSPARVRHTELCPDRLAPRTAKRSMLNRT